MTALLNGNQPSATNFGQIGTNSAANGLRGSSAVIEAATSKINASADKVNELITNYDPSNPASLLQAQHALGQYNLSLTVASSFIKSIESTAKAVAQNVS